VLIACEFSGIVRDAFAARGHNAMSCDLLPSERPGLHYQGDVRDLVDKYFDLVIFHPECTFLTNSGVRWLHTQPGRWDKLEEAITFFNLRHKFNSPRVGTENPIPHKYAREKIGGYQQLIQPWQFGHGETKATCLWLKGLPPLIPSNVVPGRFGKVWRMGPHPDRCKNRSRTYQGIAEAMAAQWG